jgi:hypothetical protein
MTIPRSGDCFCGGLVPILKLLILGYSMNLILIPRYESKT